MKRGLVLVEGQTEEQFVTQVLQPYLWAKTALWLTPRILVTKLVKSGPNFKGGILNFNQVQRDLSRLQQDHDVAVITTLFDYYGLPSHFPGMASRPDGTPRQRVDHVQSAFAAAVGDPRFLPFLALHEFEAWLFCDLGERVRWIYEGGDVEMLRAVRQSVTTPEEINEGYHTAPSRRVMAACPGYQKTLHGPLAVMEIGIDAIRAQCPHFNEWLVRLEVI
ncbi:MAG TPA: DUF4276 family protein [Kofleriaceae bacterium]|nr:DUF4276 family protein [Kofleriaceae bacterium]